MNWAVTLDLCHTGKSYEVDFVIFAFLDPEKPILDIRHGVSVKTPKNDVIMACMLAAILVFRHIGLSYEVDFVIFDFVDPENHILDIRQGTLAAIIENDVIMT